MHVFDILDTQWRVRLAAKLVLEATCGTATTINLPPHKKHFLH